jgi:RNA polymerase sigma-70 factor, ECF subfamily
MPGSRAMAQDDALLREAGIETRVAPGAKAEVVALLRERLAAARQSRPEVRIDREAFLAYLGERIPAGNIAAKTLALLRVEDLYLAWACVRGDEAALRAFDREHVEGVGRALSRIGYSDAFADEVQQRLRHRLVLSEKGKTLRIAQYSGRGPLRSWVRSSAVRLAASLQRQQEGVPSEVDADLENAEAVGADPELALMRRRYQGEFQEALRTAVKSLTTRERTILRLHHVKGLGVDRIGGIYRVHRATVARWIEAARAKLVQSTRENLSNRLQLDDLGLNSLMRVVHSQLDLTLSSILEDTDRSSRR